MASVARPNRIEPHSSGTSFLFDPALANTRDSLPTLRNTNYTAVLARSSPRPRTEHHLSPWQPAREPRPPKAPTTCTTLTIIPTPPALYPDRRWRHHTHNTKGAPQTTMLTTTAQHGTTHHCSFLPIPIHHQQTEMSHYFTITDANAPINITTHPRHQ
ncbi:hypothetical protein O3P69_009061 [Scylla paramamosain]|uniref:Uncharacterized protein n=1 Tax=Scylla paramamosain TaxID=85552 RepID=A0AAW0TQ07_SCYPA